MIARVSDYQSVSSEYYNSQLHPTCNNLREASIQALLAATKLISLRDKNALEVGAGKSVFFDKNLCNAILPKHLTLLDSSPGMLSHSSELSDVPVRFLEATAHDTTIESDSCGLIISSLGDPYNSQEVWNEFSRILEPEGVVLFTTPAFEWAQRFRATNLQEKPGLAYFELASGDQVYLPSNIYPEQVQIEMIEGAGLGHLKTFSVRKSALSTPLSPKLVLGEKDLDVVTIYAATKKPPQS